MQVHCGGPVRHRGRDAAQGEGHGGLHREYEHGGLPPQERPAHLRPKLLMAVVNDLPGKLRGRR
eukprot:scaffold1273_cov401-Prasinococcus_capsulatus_cf.AAC.8